MFLPERVQTEFTMTSDEVRNRLKLAPSKINVDDYEEKLGQLQAQFDHGLTAMAKLSQYLPPRRRDLTSRAKVGFYHRPESRGES
jgi:hypothetical protein